VTRPLPRLWLVTDDAFPPGTVMRAWTAVVAALPKGSVGLSVRSSTLEGRALADWCRALRAQGQPVVVSRRVDVALAAQLDGVHLPAHGLAVADARALLGPDAWILKAAHDATELAACAGADAAMLAPVKTPLSHASKRVALGWDALRTLREGSAVPVLAMGGLRTADAGCVLSTGAYGMAVTQDVFGAPNPAETALLMQQALGG